MYKCSPQHEALGSLEAGLNWGVSTDATLADGPGQYAPHDDRLGKVAAADIGDAQRALLKARRSAGKRAYRYARKRLSCASRKVSNRRKDRVHKLTAKLASTHRLIVTEELAIAPMTAAVKKSQTSRDEMWRKKRDL